MRINSYVEPTELESAQPVLSREESHHLARVLRVQPGQEIILFDGCGGTANAVVETVSKSAVIVRVLERSRTPKPAAQIDLYQAVPKPDRWEWVLQKAVELGVSGIYPLITERTECKPTEKKAERWQRIVLNAAQQCEVRWLPELAPVKAFTADPELFAEYDRVLIGSLYAGARRFRDVSLEGAGRVALLVGPEGDFTEAEVAQAVEAGAIPVSFGDRILRTETAAIFGLSVLAYALL